MMHSASRSWLLLSGFVLVYVVYLLFGALVFSSIERPLEDRIRRDLLDLKRDFLNQSCVDPVDLDRFLRRVLVANKFGVSILQNESGSSSWDLVSSMFFANTLVTTVGYGHTTPLSDSGKAFSIVYALLGVPLTMLVLTACVQRLMYALVAAPVRLLRRSGVRPRAAAVLHFLLLLLLVVLLCFVAPAAVFSRVETTWSLLDGVYFCFISLFTIGLGDFVPGTAPGQTLRGLYQVCTMVYLFLGLMLMFLLLRTFHKMSDLHGLTSFLQLPRCEESDLDQDQDPIVEDRDPDQDQDQDRDQDQDQDRDLAPHRAQKEASKPLEPGSQTSYNTMNTS